MFYRRKLGIAYNLVALLDMLFLEYKFDIVYPDLPGLYNILLPPSKFESHINYEISQIND